LAKPASLLWHMGKMVLIDTYQVKALPGMGLGLTKGRIYSQKALLAKCKGDKNTEKELTKKLTDRSIFVPAKQKKNATAKATPQALGLASQKNKVLKKPSAVVKSISMRRMTPSVMAIHIPPKEGDGERYMVLSLPHLGLGLREMRVYTKTDLEAKCKGDKALLEKLRAKLKDPFLFQILQ